MAKSKDPILESEQTVPVYGYHLIRNVLLEEFLGKEHEQTLYWAGKSLARKNKKEAIDDIILFFDKAGWGTLTFVKEKRNEMMLQLTSSLLEEKIPLCYQLEAGFLAEQVQYIKGYITEAVYTTKKDKVLFTLHWDEKDSIK
ncbi:YslB family protein [Bacillus sp. FJAT-45350]|uniref:YslB family protein n=1 Tax=Bacillus sp. FJAT-45350 TaxID=2011014 RepID=UPI000BB7AA93|nr:YslB family protein [Bacillus sp. FJAT-45350]